MCTKSLSSLIKKIPFSNNATFYTSSTFICHNNTATIIILQMYLQNTWHFIMLETGFRLIFAIQRIDIPLSIYKLFIIQDKVNRHTISIFHIIIYPKISTTNSILCCFHSSILNMIHLRIYQCGQ